MLAVKTWAGQKELLDSATKLQAVMGTDQHDDFHQFEDTLKAAIGDAEVELDARQKKQIITAVRWTHPDAEPVIKKIISRLGVSPGSESPAGTEPGLTPKRLIEVEPEVRAMVKADFADLKEKQIKDLLAVKTWAGQKELLDSATKLQAVMGTDQHDDFHQFEDTLKAAIGDAEVELDARQKKQIIAAVRWTHPDAEPVIKKIISRLGVSPGSESPAATEPGLTPKRLIEVEPEVRAMVKTDFADLKEKQIKDLLAVKTWADQKELRDTATKPSWALTCTTTSTSSRTRSRLPLVTRNSNWTPGRRNKSSPPSVGPTPTPNRSSKKSSAVWALAPVPNHLPEQNRG